MTNDLGYLNSYKKLKKGQKQQNKKKEEESTKIDNSFSFSVQNKQMKMHNHQEKHFKQEISVDIPQSTDMIPYHINELKNDLNEANRKRGSSHKKFRSSF